MARRPKRTGTKAKHPIAADAPSGRTVDHASRAAAYLVDVAMDLGERAAGAHAQRFMAELVAVSPPFAAGVRFFDRVAEDPEANDPSRQSGETPEGGWAVSICRLADQLDDLIAMAQPSLFADPGELLDPKGEYEPDLRLMARIARVAWENGDKRFTRKVRGWLERWAEREEDEKRFLERSRDRDFRWPWNATGPMGEVDGIEHGMRYGALLPVERRFRAVMVRARHWLQVSKRDHLVDRAADWLETFLALEEPMPRRMRGLAVAGLAKTSFLQAANEADTGRSPRCDVLERRLDEAGALLFEGDAVDPEDRFGMGWFRDAVARFWGEQNEAGASRYVITAGDS